MKEDQVGQVSSRRVKYREAGQVQPDAGDRSCRACLALGLARKAGRTRRTVGVGAALRQRRLDLP